MIITYGVGMPGFEQPLGSQYLLSEEIGHGGMGTVWRGRRRDSDLEYAIKVLKPELAGDPDVVARFVRERTLLIKLRHRNIVTVHDMIVEGNRLALVMDLIRGENLGVYRRRLGTLPPAEAAWLMAQLCDALAAAHASGIVHRDVKPGNILLDQTSNDSSIKLTDFGISRIFESGTATSANTVILGTPDYLAPEVALGNSPLPSSDIYAVGITLYELVVGRAPFTGGATGAVLMRHIEAQPQQVPGMHDELWAVIAGCLSKRPTARPEAADLAIRLRELAVVLAEEPALTPISEDADGVTYVLPARSGAAAATAMAEAAGPETRAAIAPTRVVPLAGSRPPIAAPAPRHRAAIAGVSAAAVFLIAGGVAAAVGITSKSGDGAGPPSSVHTTTRVVRTTQPTTTASSVTTTTTTPATTTVPPTTRQFTQTETTSAPATTTTTTTSTPTTTPPTSPSTSTTTTTSTTPPPSPAGGGSPTG